MTNALQRFVLFLAVVFGITSSASAANRCAPGANPGPGNCTGSAYGSAQLAINAAVSGDFVYFPANVTLTETLTLPNKGILASYITITSDAASGSLPAANVRTGPSYVAFMGRLQSPGGGASAVYFASGANHYKFTHINFLWVPQGFGEIVSFGAGDFSQTLESQEPTDAIFDQVYVLGDAVAGQKRAFGVNGKRFTLTNSYVARIHSVGQDSQCVQGTNGHGPIDIENNYLECATENFILGGADPAIRTFMHVTASTTTSASVTTYETGHTLAELKVGQFIAVQTVAGTPSYNSLQYTTISTVTGTGTTGSITFPTLTVAPVIGGDIRAQVIPDGITFKRNHVTKDPNWFLGVMLAPASPTATSGGAGGSLTAGQYCYQVQAFSLNGYQGNTVNSALSTEQCITIAANIKVTVAFTAVSGSTSYRIWRGTSPGAENQWTSVPTSVCSPGCSTSDDGSLVYTSATPFGATQVDTKNLFELKCATNVVVSGNIFDTHKKGSDVGFASWWKTVNQDGNGWACQTAHVLVELNIWSNINGWAELHGQEAGGNPFPGPMTDVTFRNNLVYGSSYLNGGDIYALNISQAANSVTFDHNTVINVTDGNGGGLLALDSTAAPLVGLVIKNNMLRSETYGIHDPTGSGAAALTAAAPGFSFINNGVAAGAAPPYTSGSGNVYPTLAAWKAAFTTYTDDGSGGADYTILSSGGGASYHNAGSDGKDIGADIAAVNAATAGVLTGTGSSLAITLPVLPTGVRTVAYAATQTCSGGTPPCTYAVTSGTQPAGASLASGGAWSGTPTTTASYTFTVTATDSASHTATQAYTVQILDPITISTTSPLPGGVTGTAYNTSIAWSGGQAPYSCTFTGSLPTGLSLGAVVAQTCPIIGTPSGSGTNTPTITIAGALGSSASLVASITIGAEALPSGRLSCGAISGISHCAQIFRQATAPANPGDKLAKGDLWIDISKDPPAHNTFNAAGAWVPDSNGGAVSGDGGGLTNLDAGQISHGTIPNAAFPPSLNISQNVTAPTFGGVSGSLTGFVELVENVCDKPSLAGKTRLCMDVADHLLKASVHGAAFAAVGSGGGTASTSSLSNTDATMNISLVNDANDPYTIGSSTSNSRNFKLYSYQGSLWQAFTLHDANASTDYVFAFCTSSNTGSTWLCPMKVRQDGLLNVSYLTLASIASYTCDSAHAGQFNYIQGNATTKDIVQICAHDASNVYAWRAIY